MWHQHFPILHFMICYYRTSHHPSDYAHFIKNLQTLFEVPKPIRNLENIYSHLDGALGTFHYDGGSH